MKPISLPLPLRQTTIWGGFREAAPIPHRYGYASGNLLQYNDSRMEFVWADHAVEGIDEALVNGQTVGDWDWRNGTDNTGHAIAIVRFGQPQDEGVTIIARGRGKIHPTDGRSMTNPADVVWDMLNLAGRNIPAASLSDFRRDCDRNGLEIGGSIEAAESPQTIGRAICESIGAVYCHDMPGLCRLWPGFAGASRLKISNGEFKAATTLDGLVNDLTIQYAHEDGSPRASVQLDAPDSIARFGSRPATLDARWLTSARVAASVGRRLLEQKARAQWAITLNTKSVLSVGDAVTLAHPEIPATGKHVVLSRDRDIDAGNGQITVRAAVGSVPTVRLVRQSSAFEPAQYSNVTVDTVGGQRILTLVEESGQPIVGAKVTLDGRIVAYTDAGGRVSFPVSAMPPGEHTLVALTTDGRTLTMTVLIT